MTAGFERSRAASASALLPERSAVACSEFTASCGIRRGRYGGRNSSTPRRGGAADSRCHGGWVGKSRQPPGPFQGQGPASSGADRPPPQAAVRTSDGNGKSAAKVDALMVRPIALRSITMRSVCLSREGSDRISTSSRSESGQPSGSIVASKSGKDAQIVLGQNHPPITWRRLQAGVSVRAALVRKVRGKPGQSGEEPIPFRSRPVNCPGCAARSRAPRPAIRASGNVRGTRLEEGRGFGSLSP